MEQHTTRPAATRGNLALVDVPHGGIQLRLPHLRFDAARGCDRIRRRVYADSRIRPLVAAALLALSEFVDGRRKAWPKQELIAKMLHTRREVIGRALTEAAQLDVLEKDRSRPGGRCTYTFRESWVQWFHDDDQKQPSVTSGSDSQSHPEVTLSHFSTEPYKRTNVQEPPPRCLCRPCRSSPPARAKSPKSGRRGRRTRRRSLT